MGNCCGNPNINEKHNQTELIITDSHKSPNNSTCDKSKSSSYCECEVLKHSKPRNYEKRFYANRWDD